MAGSKQVSRPRTKGKKSTKPDASPGKAPKTTARINREARKRQKRKERIALLKEAHRRCTEERYAKGEKPWKPCHICRKEGHWDRDCPKYGAWKAKMEAKKA